VSAVWVFAHEDIEKHAACHLCGMDMAKFANSRILIEYDDGTIAATCGIHCAAIELAVNIDKTPKTIKVGDYLTKDLINAEMALWVLGGKKPGIMSTRAKWAFGKKDDAERFIRDNGGSLVTFDEIMKAAYEDMYADTKMMRNKRRMMKMKMSEGK
jgi:nitrous oxide reductase accessory protein NosL